LITQVLRTQFSIAVIEFKTGLNNNHPKNGDVTIVQNGHIRTGPLTDWHEFGFITIWLVDDFDDRASTGAIKAIRMAIKTE